MASHYYDLGVALFNKHHYEEAIAHFRKALETEPGLIHAYNYIGNALQAKHHYDEAISCYKTAIRMNPNDPTAYINLGIVLQNMKQADSAISYFKQALTLNPSLHQAYEYMGLSFTSQGKNEEAVDSYRRSLQINPYSVMSLVNLGNVLSKLGKLNEAELLYKTAMQVRPDNPKPFQAFLMTMHYNSRYNAQAMFSEHLRFAKQHAEPLAAHISPHMNDRSPARRLRIGYVSPDFKRHSVAYFIEPVLAAHHREQFEVFCYSAVDSPDGITDRIKKNTDRWTDIAGMSDEEAEELVRKDAIDILIDLAGHTNNNRLLLFARKPAPIQVSWIGYPATTGLSTMDYRIVDRFTDPPGTTEQFYTEKLMWMPESFLCFLPDEDSPDVGPLPALKAAHITFGSFNNLAKVSPELIDLWITLLKSVPDSHLIIKAEGLIDSMTRNYMMNAFHQQGVDFGRLELLPWTSSVREHLEAYHRIDIGLDTFPYNGTTTTCEALWMGVPVITLSGDTHASRVGASLLSNMGLTMFIARTSEEYVRITAALAADIHKLKTLREQLRTTMRNSPLTNAGRLTADLENCFTQMWQKYCAEFLG
jgi:protein O-GlcNAc transferase